MGPRPRRGLRGDRIVRTRDRRHRRIEDERLRPLLEHLIRRRRSQRSICRILEKMGISNLTGHPCFIAPCGPPGEKRQPPTVCFTGQLYGESRLLALLSGMVTRMPDGGWILLNILVLLLSPGAGSEENRPLSARTCPFGDWQGMLSGFKCPRFPPPRAKPGIRPFGRPLVPPPQSRFASCRQHNCSVSVRWLGRIQTSPSH